MYWVLTLVGENLTLMVIAISEGFSATNVQFFFFFLISESAAENPSLMVILVSGRFSTTNMQEHYFFQIFFSIFAAEYLPLNHRLGSNISGGKSLANGHCN